MSEPLNPFRLTDKDREFLRLQRIKPDDPEPVPAAPVQDVDDDGEQTDVS